MGEMLDDLGLAWVKSADQNSNAPPHKAMLTVRETYEYLRISKGTLYRMISSNEIKSVKMRGRRLIKRETLENFVEQLEKREG